MIYLETCLMATTDNLFQVRMRTAPQASPPEARRTAWQFLRNVSQALLLQSLQCCMHSIAALLQCKMGTHRIPDERHLPLLQRRQMASLLLDAARQVSPKLLSMLRHPTAQAKPGELYVREP